MEKDNRLSLQASMAMPLFAVWLLAGCYSSSTGSRADDIDARADTGSEPISTDDAGRNAMAYDARQDAAAGNGGQKATTSDQEGGSSQPLGAEGGSDGSTEPSAPPTNPPPSAQRDAGVSNTTPRFELPALPTAQDGGSTTSIPPPPLTSPDAGDGEFSGGLQPGERAPAPGEVPSNVYGGPAVPWGPYEPGFPSECDDTGGAGWAISGPEVNPCIAYNLCVVQCNVDSDCDDGGSGDAIPTCNLKGVRVWPSDFSGSCELACDDETVCPDGMACVHDYDRSLCLWPADIAHPECPAWCELDPLPKGCPGWCAVAGVGCDPDAEGYCCEGLVCGSEGWCIQEESE